MLSITDRTNMLSLQTMTAQSQIPEDKIVPCTSGVEHNHIQVWRLKGTDLCAMRLQVSFQLPFSAGQTALDKVYKQA